MYTLPVPPFVEVRVATTDEEMRLLCRQHVVVKPPLGGTSRSNLDGVVKQWSQEVILAGMRDPSLELRRVDNVGPLSTLTITQAAKRIIDNFDGIINPDDVFYLAYPQSISRLAAGVRNTLQVAEGRRSRNRKSMGCFTARRNHSRTGCLCLASQPTLR